MSLSFLCNDLSKCSGINKDTAPSFLMDDFADMSMESVYVMDFLKRKFCYVPDNNFLLNGYSVEEVISLGYEFYKLVIHKDDYPLVLNIYKEILLRLRHRKKNEKIRYFSFYLRIRNGSDYVMIYNKIKPVFVSGKFRFGICMLSSSIASKAGDLRLYFKNSAEYEKYLPSEKRWQKKKEQHLTPREKRILKLAIQGHKGYAIADAVGLSHQALRSALSTIYRKLNVQSLVQAIIYTLNHRLLLSPDPSSK